MRYTIDVPEEIDMQPLAKQFFEGHGYVECKIEKTTMKTQAEVEERRKNMKEDEARYSRRLPGAAYHYMAVKAEIDWVLGN